MCAPVAKVLKYAVVLRAQDILLPGSFQDTSLIRTSYSVLMVQRFHSYMLMDSLLVSDAGCHDPSAENSIILLAGGFF